MKNTITDKKQIKSYLSTLPNETKIVCTAKRYSHSVPTTTTMTVHRIDSGIGVNWGLDWFGAYNLIAIETLENDKI